MTELLISIIIFISLYFYLSFTGGLAESWLKKDPERKSIKWAVMEVITILIFSASGLGPIILINNINNVLHLILFVFVIAINLYIFKTKYKHLKIKQPT